jgi:hypothetical protein
MITKILLRLLLLGFVFSFAVSTGHATMTVVQKNISVSRELAGYVYVGTYGPERGATVDLCTSDWKAVIASKKTDEQRYFSFEKPANEKLFYIRVSAKGLDQYELRVRIKKNATQELKIRVSVAT